MKELSLDCLTVKQKLGLVMTGHIYDLGQEDLTNENMEYALQMIRDHALGAIWVEPNLPHLDKIMQRIKEAADYPILIITDAESGIAEHKIGRVNSLGRTGNPELAYIFGKVTAVTARKMGYNVICNPVLDMAKSNRPAGSTVRSMGNDKYKVTELAIAEAQGLHDGGVLTVGKHYPSPTGHSTIDSHLAEAHSMNTVEELLDYNLYPWLELNKQGLLDGMMTGHTRLPNIDPDYPSSLSKKIIGIIRDQGFEGFAITDALVMLGISAKFGMRECRGLSIANGNDLALTWYENKDAYESICESYDQGVLTDECLDVAVTRVLAAQKKTLAIPKFTDLTEEDLLLFDSIDRDSVVAITDEGVPTALDTEGKHFFVVMTENGVSLADRNKVSVDTMLTKWNDPNRIIDKIMSLYPNSYVRTLDEFPSPAANMHLVEDNLPYDDVVYVTYMEGKAYMGTEHFTSRITSVIEALQVTNRISTIVHFGNPYALEDLVHIPRILIGGLSAASVDYTLDVLAGKYPAKGVLTYDIKLK